MPAGHSPNTKTAGKISDECLREQVQDLRCAFDSIMRIRYSDRTDQAGYFLLVLPDGSLATQFTDHRDKVILGNALTMSQAELQNNRLFDLREHGRKWVAAAFEVSKADQITEALWRQEPASLAPNAGV